MKLLALVALLGSVLAGDCEVCTGSHMQRGQRECCCTSQKDCTVDKRANRLSCTISTADGMTWEQYGTPEGHGQLVRAAYYGGLKPGDKGFPGEEPREDDKNAAPVKKLNKEQWSETMGLIKRGLVAKRTECDKCDTDEKFPGFHAQKCVSKQELADRLKMFSKEASADADAAAETEAPKTESQNSGSSLTFTPFGWHPGSEFELFDDEFDLDELEELQDGNGDPGAGTPDPDAGAGTPDPNAGDAGNANPDPEDPECDTACKAKKAASAAGGAIADGAGAAGQAITDAGKKLKEKLEGENGLYWALGSIGAILAVGAGCYCYCKKDKGVMEEGREGGSKVKEALL